MTHVGAAESGDRLGPVTRDKKSAGHVRGGIGFAADSAKASPGTNWQIEASRQL